MTPGPDLHDIARQVFMAGLAAVEPRRAVGAALHCRNDLLEVADLPAVHLPRNGSGNIILIGAGKASAPMAQAVEDVLGDRVSGGVVVVKHGHGAPLVRARLREAGHPVPDQAGVLAAKDFAASVQGLAAGDLVVFCLSGGASSLLVAPRPGLSLEDKQAVTRALLACGADIHEVNAVRKHCSLLKGGQLARLAAPASLVTLAVSDVIGDDPSVIGSGPTSPDPSTFITAEEVIRRYGIADSLPPAVVALIRRGVQGLEPETAKAAEDCFRDARYAMVASNRLAQEAASAQARALGMRPELLAAPLHGEAVVAARAFAGQALKLRQDGRPVCLIGGGETTVTLQGAIGQGGRSQEFALACALALDGIDGIAILAAGTDGNDGPTDAAGGMVDGTTCGRGRAQGLDPLAHLAGHNALPFLEICGSLLRTGPTRTNVMDLAIAVIAPGSRG